MANKNTVTLEFAGDEKKLTKSMDNVGKASKQLENSVGTASTHLTSETGKSSRSVGAAFRSMKGAIIGAGIGAAVGGITTFISGMVEEARDAEKVGQSTARGIQSIGAASWTSAQQIGDLSEAISNKIGVDDELIQQSANLLLTFKNVKNAAGQNNDVFNRAVAASQDLAAKGFGSADSAAKMLGKALNDPLKGITALSRAGVTFTQGQKDQIEAMVKSGNLLGAQKLIMKELEAQVGGTAEATATAGDKMVVTWGNFQEKLGTEILPLLDGALTHLNKFIEWAGEHQVIVGAIAGITAGIWLLNAALAANPIILVISLVAALVVGLIVLWEKSAGFRDFFIGVWHGIQNVVGSVVGWVRDRWNALTNFFRTNPMGRVVAAIFRGMVGAIGAVVDAIGWLIGRISDAVGLMMQLIGLQGQGKFVEGTGIKTPNFKKKHHSGGVVTGGIMGQEVLRTLQVGEKVTPAGQSGGGDGGRLEVVGDVDSLFATYLKKLVRDGTLRLA